MEQNYRLFLYNPAAIGKEPGVSRNTDFLGELLVDNLNVNLKLSDLSDISFTLPKIINGEGNTRLDEVLDNYIVELWYGSYSAKEKYRFVLTTIPLSFDGTFSYEYRGLSIEAFLENKQIINWNGIEIKDFYRKVFYNKNETTFTDSDTTALTIQAPIMSGDLELSAGYIEISPTIETVTPTDLFITEERKNDDVLKSSGLISYEYDWTNRASNTIKFAAGHYYLVMDGDYIETIRIAIPSVAKDLTNFLSSTSGHEFFYKIYDNPTSRYYAAGITTNDGVPADNYYFDLVTSYKNGTADPINGHSFSTEDYYSKNGLRLKQVLIGDINETKLNEDGLLYSTGFTIGTISDAIALKYRSNLEFNNITRYQAIKTLAQSYDAIAVFDSFTNKVSFYEENETHTSSDYGINNGLIIQYGTYLKSINKEIDAGKIATYYLALGKDNLTINLINPDGSSAWEDYTYYLDDYKYLTVTYSGSWSFGSTTGFNSRWMSNVEALNLSKWQKVRDYFHNILSGVNTTPHADHAQYVNLYAKRDEAIRDYVKQETQYEEFSALKYKYKVFVDYYSKNNVVNPSTENNDRYNYYKGLYDKALSAEPAKKSELEAKYKLIFDVATTNSYAKLIDNIKQILNSYKSSISSETLLAFRKETVFRDTNLDNEKDLINALVKFVEENREPKITINIDIIDILAAQEAEQDHNKIIIGDKINLLFQEFNIDLEAQIMEVSIDFEQNSLSLVISTTKNYNRGFGANLNKIVRKLYNIANNKSDYQYDESVYSNAAAQATQQTIDNNLIGVTISSGPEDASGVPGSEQSSAGTTVSEITYIDPLTGTPTYAENTQRLDISSGSVIATSKTGATNFVKVGMGSEFGFFIAKSDDNEETYNKQMYLDTDGNAVFGGNLSLGQDQNLIGFNNNGIYAGKVPANYRYWKILDIDFSHATIDETVSSWPLPDISLYSDGYSILYSPTNTIYISFTKSTDGYGFSIVGNQSSIQALDGNLSLSSNSFSVNTIYNKRIWTEEILSNSNAGSYILIGSMDIDQGYIELNSDSNTAFYFNGGAPYDATFDVEYFYITNLEISQNLYGFLLSTIDNTYISIEDIKYIEFKDSTNSSFNLSLQPVVLSASRVINLPNKSGTVALLDDISYSGPTKTLLGTRTSTVSGTLTVADLDSYDEIRVEVYVATGTGSYASPTLGTTHAVQSTRDSLEYAMDSMFDIGVQNGIGVYCGSSQTSSTGLYVNVKQYNAAGTSVYVTVSGTATNLKTVKVYGINW